MTDIVETIDGAIEDYEVSVDAMRWRPGGGTEPEPAGVDPPRRSLLDLRPGDRIAVVGLDEEPVVMTVEEVEWTPTEERIAAAYGVPPALVGAEDAANAESLTLAAAQLFAEAFGVPMTSVFVAGSPADPSVRRVPRSRGGFAPSAVWVDETAEFADDPPSDGEWSAENLMLVRGGKPAPAVVPHVEAAVERRRAERAVSPRVPVYRDDRPRWRSPYGPAGRR